MSWIWAARAASSISSSVAVRLGEAEVLAHGGVEEVGLLRDDADGVGERVEGELAQVGAVDRHGALLGVVQPRGEVAERRLAGAGLTHQRGARARGDRDVDVAQRPLVAVAEPDVVEAHLAADVVQLLASRARCRRSGPGTRRRARTARCDVWMSTATREQRLDREEEARLQRREGDDRADDWPPRGEAGEQVDQRGHHRERASGSRTSSSGRPSASAPRGRRGSRTPCRSGPRARRRGPSSCRAGCR